MDRYSAIRAGMQAGLQGKTGWGRNEVLMLLDSVLLDVAQEEIATLQRPPPTPLPSPTPNDLHVYRPTEVMPTLVPDGRCGPDKRPVELPPFVPGPANPQVYGPIKRPVPMPLDLRSTAVEDNPPWD
jgi:hypothetical protein